MARDFWGRFRVYIDLGAQSTPRRVRLLTKWGLGAPNVWVRFRVQGLGFRV